MKASINPEIAAILDRHLSNGRELRAALETALHARHQKHSLQVTTCGLLKAGKSSLLNALTDHLDKELFATGAVRTTIRNQTLSHENFVFVDTPGLDATAKDDAEAWKGIQEADVLLFVHHPGTGELHGAEVAFLEQVASMPGAHTGLDARLVVVLSHLDSYRHNMEGILKRVRSQIQTCLGIEPRIFPVSFTTYRKGHLEGKPQLVAHSGIPELREHLVSQFVTLSERAQQAREARVAESRQRLMAMLDAEIQAREQRFVTLNAQVKKCEQQFEKDFNTLLNNLKSKIFAYKEILKPNL